MGELVSVLLKEVVSGYGFDVDATDALRALNRAHKTMVRRARLRKGQVVLGTTVVGQRDYVLDDHGVLEVLDLEVGGVPYNRAPRRAQQDYARGTLSWSPQGVGLFVDTADGFGVGSLGLIPPPSEADLSIVVYGAIEAEPLESAGVVLVPTDYEDALVGQAAASFYRKEPEQAGTARELEGMFDAKCEELRHAVAKQKRGAGPAMIRVARR
jgi:hypothetical protein